MDKLTVETTFFRSKPVHFQGEALDSLVSHHIHYYIYKDVLPVYYPPKSELFRWGMLNGWHSIH